MGLKNGENSSFSEKTTEYFSSRFDINTPGYIGYVYVEDEIIKKVSLGGVREMTHRHTDTHTHGRRGYGY